MLNVRPDPRDSGNYDVASGRLKDAMSVAGTDYLTADFFWLTYDVLGNLTSKRRSSGNPFDPDVEAKQAYCYDNLNRLTKVTEGTLFPSCSGPQMTYDAFGNLKSKTGRTYTYGAGTAGPHAVTSVAEPGQGTLTYTYDANGNMRDGDGRDFTYSVFDQMTKVERGTTDTLEFAYGIDRQRYYRAETIGSSVTKTFYQGSVERVESPTGTEMRRRIGGEVVITHPLDANGNILDTKRRYQMLDHLGSPIAVYDNTAANLERLSFGAWGARRNYDTQAILPPYNANFVSGVDTDTVRGYTGHEHGDAFGIIHMNGRIYDPTLGRMLQADPFIQFPTNTQSYNRYSYVLNNPLGYTDPSGYFSLKDVFKIAAVVAISYVTYGAVNMWATAAFTTPAATATMSVGAMSVTTVMTPAAISTAGVIGAGAIAGGAAGFAAGTSIAAFSGASLGDALKAGGRGAFAGAISGGFGAFGSSFGAFGRIASVAAGGCGAGKASGGSCKTGATYAGMAAALTVAMENSSGYKVTSRTASSGAVVKEQGTVIYSENASNIGLALFAPAGSDLIGLPINSLTPEQLGELQIYNPKYILGSGIEGYTVSRISEGGSFFQGIARYLPGANGASNFHDFFASYYQLGAILNPATIPPAFYLYYEGLGVRSYMYMADNLND